MAQDEVAGDGAARSVQGASGGLAALAVDATTVIPITVTEWVGRYVKIVPVGEGLYYVFSNDDDVGGLDITATSVDSASPEVTSPDFTPDGVAVHELVPGFGEGKETYLLVLSLSATTVDVRVRPA